MLRTANIPVFVQETSKLIIRNRYSKAFFFLFFIISKFIV